MAIRYDKKLQQEIYRTVSNFNAKVRRLKKQGNELLPERATVSELKRTSTSRRDLRRELNRLKRFSRRGAEKVISVGKGVPMTSYEANNLLIEYRRASRRVNQSIKKASISFPSVFGKKQDATFKEMRSELYTSLEAKRTTLDRMRLKNLSQSNIQSFKKLITKINKPYISNTFKSNYLDMLTSTGYYYGYDTEKLEEIEKRLMNLDDVNFTELFNEDASLKAVIDYYLRMRMTQGISPDSFKDDVKVMYDEFYSNLDDILKSYK